jgi:small conductance mechanosensitive channel
MSSQRLADTFGSLVAAILVILVCASVAAAQDIPGPGSALIDEAERLVERIDKRRQEIDEWTELREKYEGDDRRAIVLELTEKKLQALSDLHRLADNVVQQESQGLDSSAIRARVESMMRDLPPLIRGNAEEAGTNASELRAQRDEASPEELLDLELRIAEEDSRINRIAQIYLEHIRAMESMGLDAAADREWLVDGLSKRADFLSRRIELTLATESRLEDQAADSPDDAAIADELKATGERLDSNVQSLRATIEMMGGLGLETTQYRQLIVQTTGDITDLLETEVALGLASRLLENAKQWIRENGPGALVKLVVFVLVLLLFRLLARMARRITVRSLASSKVTISRLLEDMITSMVQRVVMIFGLLVALSQIGVSLGPLLAGLGVAGFIVGFALQDVLSNVASGVMILFYRSFDVDDLIEVGGVSGKVSRMTLVSTTILTLDHQTLVVPNSKIWGDVIKNVTAQTVRRVDMTFGIAYHDDIPKAERLLNAVVEEHSKVLEDPEPIVRLHNLGDSSVDFVVRPWVATDDYWDVYWDITREVKMRFDREGVSIPFPQRDVHLYQEAAATT